MRVLIAGNPASGGFSDDVRAAIDRELPGAEWFAPDDGDLGEAAGGFDVVAVAGGDGTLNHAVNALAGRLDDVRLGLIPLGTGNDFARTAGVPDDAAEAARVVATGRSRAFDVGRATGGGVSRLFVNACMGGFPVQVDEAIDEEAKRRLGPLAFWVGGAKAAAGLRRSTVVVDGVPVPECVAAGVGNGRTCGGGIPVWPDADPADGSLDGCALAAPNAAAAIRLLLKVRSGEHAGLDGVATARAGRIELDADPPMELNVDGELVGLTTPATFEVAGRFTLIT
ncbi:MAG TPA: YegS/Rv2252/BmrU family lipid kinase [Actinomycetota bacterium]|nr:YegS/Rv2252/BmrU family lipid kinase [Actinomycetota bacterium]